MKKKNPVIELYRFLFTCTIYIYHFRSYSGIEKIPGNFSGGYLGVEFFFLISGFFLMKSIDKQQKLSNKSQNGNSASFLWHRISRLYPEYIVSILLLLFCTCLVSQDKHLFVMIKNGFPDLLCIQVFFTDKNINSILWFVSVLIWAELLINFMFYRTNKKLFEIIGILFSSAYLSFVFFKIGFLDLTQNKFFYLDGFCRGLSELIIGCLIFVAVQRLKNAGFSMRQSVIKSFSIIILVIATLLMFYGKKNRLDFIVLILLILLVFVEGFREQSLTNNRYNSVFIFLGTISYGMYLNQVLIQKIIHTLLPGRNFWIMTVISILLLMSISGIIHCCIGLFFNVLRNRTMNK